MKLKDWTKVEPAKANSNNDEIKRLVAGGYVMRVISAIDEEDRDRVVLLFDITEGEFAGYGEKCETVFGNDWNYPKLYAGNGERTEKQFRRMLDLFESENKGKFSVATFKNDVSKLEGLLIGVVLDEDDYNDKFRVKPNYFKLTTLDDIRKQKYKVKYLPESRKNELLAEEERKRKEKNSPTVSTINEETDDYVPFFK